MNYLLCKCDKNQIQEEKTAMDLLDIKNLEMSLKNKEKKLLNQIFDSNRNTITKENLNTSEEELEIIDYPYSNKINNNKNNNSKIKKNKNFNFINFPKTNNINRNKNLFNNEVKNNNKKDDINNSSLNNNDSLIIDDIDYLNDEDIIKIPKKKLKKQENNKVNFFNVINKNKKNKRNISSNINNISKDSLILKSKISTLKGSKKNSNKNRIYSLSHKKEDKKFLRKFNNIIEKSFNKNKKGVPLNNSTIHNNNKQKMIKEQLFKNDDISKNKNLINSNNKRIKKRRVNIKQIKLDLIK